VQIESSITITLSYLGEPTPLIDIAIIFLPIFSLIAPKHHQPSITGLNLSIRIEMNQ
jgi:hypothetical protein